MPHHIKQYVCFNLYLVRMMCMLSQCGVNWYACNSSMVLRHCSALEHEKHQFLVLALGRRLAAVLQAGVVPRSWTINEAEAQQEAEVPRRMRLALAQALPLIAPVRLHRLEPRAQPRPLAPALVRPGPPRDSSSLTRLLWGRPQRRLSRHLGMSSQYARGTHHPGGMPTPLHALLHAGIRARDSWHDYKKVAFAVV